MKPTRAVFLARAAAALRDATRRGVRARWPVAVPALGGFVGSRCRWNRASIANSASSNITRRSFTTTSARLNQEQPESKDAEIPFDKLTEEEQATLTDERVADSVDVCIVGGGPAGLATAIRLKQLDNEHGSGELRVVVLEKAGDFGSHIVSGAVIEPLALKELFPDSEYLNEDGSGIPLPEDMATLVTSDSMNFLTLEYAIPLPEPPQMANHNKNYIVSLNNVVQWLSEQAEELGVELFPGISVSEVLYTEAGAVRGVATKDMGIDKQGRPKPSFERGMEFNARVTVLGEGCHGSLSKEIIAKYNLRKNKEPQTYGLGIKEVWEVRPENFNKGAVVHSLGYPLTSSEYGGGFLYHFGENMVAVGIVVGLDYPNPYVSPYQEFQRMKLHPLYSNVLEGGKCLTYAARALNEGGFQSIPQLYFPGGVLVGCTAGFVNVPKVKGTHTAIKSGMLAADSIFEEIKDLEPVDESTFEEEIEPIVLKSYETAFENSWIYEELYQVRNVRPSFNSPLGILGGLAHSGFSTMISNGAEPWTLKHGHTDAEATRDAKDYAPIDYPKPDGKITFDLLTSVSRTGTYHDDNETCHLRIPGQDYDKHAEISYPKYKGVEQRFCPAGVYEYVENDSKPLGVEFKINSQNCIHCKTCDIKVPTQDINWTVPEGGDGPKYYMS